MNMKPTFKKRQIIDIDEGTFKILSIQADSLGTNLKSLIENLLKSLAQEIEEESRIYDTLLKEDKEANIFLDKTEKEDFENWLGV